MRILAIETVGSTGSIAALVDDSVLEKLELASDRRSAQSLAPGIEALLRQVAWRTEDVELVAVASGPGSFTGLRIGLTTAKVFAYAVGCPVAGVNSLAAIASRAPQEIERLTALLEAGRGELFVAQFERVAAEMVEIQATHLVKRREWLESLQAGDTVSGPALAEMIAELPRDLVVLDPTLWTPSASAIGRIGWRKFLAGQHDDAFSLVPQYFRRTAAEEQWERKQSR